MFHLKGTTRDGRKVLAIGIPKRILKGVANSNMVLTLDSVMGAKIGTADYVALLQANSLAELERKMAPIFASLGGTITRAEAYAPGVIEEFDEEGPN